jgi:hypothetical protein
VRRVKLRLGERFLILGRAQGGGWEFLAPHRGPAPLPKVEALLDEISRLRGEPSAAALPSPDAEIELFGPAGEAVARLALSPLLPEGGAYAQGPRGGPAVYLAAKELARLDLEGFFR